ncbi:MAG: 4-(cytidine 5'-diphospho)-2-C-methyl-D-erythritol kinase [Chitinophagaceae bacterium]|nr:4-(cytidine 5'-diphospho)-2-C-methyl-D-erythritol kinase [Chitinophagaceae bacterium]
MIQFSPCKINLGLSILEKRVDSFHALETVFYPVGLHDIVEIVPEKLFKFSHTGISIPGEAFNNLCVKAYQLLKADFPQMSSVQMHLHKNIPMGAGLGGGSADGTTVLILLNQLFELKLTQKQLLDYAASLGSDCPFFIFNEACHATGRGEILAPISIDLSNYTIALIHPGIHIATSWAFQQLSPCVKEKSILTIIKQPMSTWKTELINDFEAPVFKAHPQLEAFKNNLYEQGAIYASMSGSGSSLFGIFPKGTKLAPPDLGTSIRVDHI